MKKLFSLLTLVVVALSLQAKDYQIWVKGIQVTDANCENVLGDGKVSFNPTMNWLQFGKDARIEVTGTTPVVKINQDVTLLFAGEGETSLRSAGNVVEVADGKKVRFSALSSDDPNVYLTATGTRGSAVSCGSGCELTFVGVRIHGDGPASFVSSTAVGGVKTKVTLDGMELSISSKGKVQPFADCQSVKLVECKVSEPQGATWVGGANGFQTADGAAVTGRLEITPINYNIEIGNIRLNGRNRWNVLGGTVSFSPEDNELVLSNAHIDDYAVHGLLINNTNTSSKRAFRIQLKGKNTIKGIATSGAMHWLNPQGVDSVLIYSNEGGSLEISHDRTWTSCIQVNDVVKRLTFKNCSINLINNALNTPAIQGGDSAKTTLCFINATVKAETNDLNVIENIGGVEYHGCYLKTTAKAFFSPAFHRFVTDDINVGGGLQKMEVVPGTDNAKPWLAWGEELKITQRTATSIHIAFKTAQDNTTAYDKMRYHVYLADGGTNGSWLENYDVKPTFTDFYNATIDVKNLKQNYHYLLILRTYDAAGNSVEYQGLDFTTGKNTNPQFADTLLTITAYKRQIDVRWHAATDDYTPASELQYFVEYKKVGAPAWKEIKLGNATSCSIKELEPNTEYLVDVRVEDTDGGYNRFGAHTIKTQEVAIYNVSICGEPLAADNLNKWITKNIRFNPETNTIILNNADLTSTNSKAPVIEVKDGDYTIQFKGVCLLNGGTDAISAQNSCLTITSNGEEGTLFASSAAPESCGIKAWNSVLEIDNCDVKLNSNEYVALSGYGTGSLAIINSSVSARGKVACISDWNSIELINCSVVEPQDAEIADISRGVLGIAVNGEVVANQMLTIEPFPDGISTTTTLDSLLPAYTLQGTRASENYRGIILQGGKKVLKR